MILILVIRHTYTFVDKFCTFFPPYFNCINSSHWVSSSSPLQIQQTGQQILRVRHHRINACSFCFTMHLTRDVDTNPYLRTLRYHERLLAISLPCFSPWWQADNLLALALHLLRFMPLLSACFFLVPSFW